MSKKIVCPYCCHRFDASNMWFRFPESNEDEEEVDEKLKHYYMEYGKMSELDAESEARLPRAIAIDLANDSSKITDYSQKMMQEHGFVTELRYDGKRLTKRLCPNCHNEVVQGAGLHEMRLIAMYGNTSAGKTVFLNVLEAMLTGDSRLGQYIGAFHGTMTFLGDTQAMNLHKADYKQLIAERKLIGATASGVRVAPQAFRFVYSTAERKEEQKKLIIVFCDIAGEDTMTVEGLQRSGYYLRNVDGIIALLDATKLPRVMPQLNGTVAAQGGGGSAWDASQALGALETYLENDYRGKIKIPTAVVLTKVDVLKNHAQLLGLRTDVLKNIFVPEANGIHKEYLDKKAITELGKSVKRVIIEQGGEVYTTHVNNCFKEYNYFAISALGKDPVEEDGMQKISGFLEPFRVAEPFYWLLAKMDLIPYRFYELWQNNRGGKEKIEFFYYESERGGKAQQKLKNMKESRNIKDSGLIRKVTWKLADRPDGI